MTVLFGVPRLVLAAGLAMLVVISVLLIDNLQLRKNIRQTATERAASQKRESDVRAQRNDQQASNDVKASASQPPASPAANNAGSIGQHVDSQIASLPVSVTAFTLAPQMRGATQMADLILPQVTTQAAFRLTLESNDFPRYRATLINVTSERALWHSASLKAVTKGENSMVSANIPAKLLHPEIYQLDLAGVSANGEPEFVSSYVFRIETR